MKNPIVFLRRVALMEGVSFLLLLGIAMPLKYLANLPMAVKIAGWGHGLLFVMFCYALLQTLLQVKNWALGRSVAVFISALLPLGPFMLDRKMRQWEQEAELEDAA